MMMNTRGRQDKIINILSKTDGAISASSLAEQLQVSRQVIVGDIALLRAKGIDIISTFRGYIYNQNQVDPGVTFKVACVHDLSRTRDELYAIVDNGGEVIDVIVEHPVYGQLVGQLNISSRFDTDDFLRKIESENATLLSDLTYGIHIHTISCRDDETAGRIRKALQKLDILLSEQ